MQFIPSKKGRGEGGTPSAHGGLRGVGPVGAKEHHRDAENLGRTQNNLSQDLLLKKLTLRLET